MQQPLLVLRCGSVVVGTLLSYLPVLQISKQLIPVVHLQGFQSVVRGAACLLNLEVPLFLESQFLIGLLNGLLQVLLLRGLVPQKLRLLLNLRLLSICSFTLVLVRLVLHEFPQLPQLSLDLMIFQGLLLQLLVELSFRSFAFDLAAHLLQASQVLGQLERVKVLLVVLSELPERVKLTLLQQTLQLLLQIIFCWIKAQIAGCFQVFTQLL